MIKEDLLGNYDHLESGWKEQEEEFKDRCEVSLTAISEETFNAMVEDGYDWMED